MSDAQPPAKKRPKPFTSARFSGHAADIGDVVLPPGSKLVLRPRPPLTEEQVQEAAEFEAALAAGMEERSASKA